MLCLGEVKDGCVRIGDTSISVGTNTDAAAMVPDVLFYDNQLVSIHYTTTQE